MDHSTADLAWPPALHRDGDLPAAVSNGLDEELVSAQVAYLALLRAAGHTSLADRVERIIRADPLDLESMVAWLTARLTPILDDYTAGDLIDLDDYEDEMTEIADAIGALDDWTARASGQIALEGL